VLVTLLRSFSALLLIGFASAAAAIAVPPTVIGVDHLNIYGTTVHFLRDSRVPGAGAVRAEPRAAAGEEWSSGTAVAAPFAVRSGERLSSIFWARANRPVTITATLHGGAPDYKSLGAATVDLTRQWRRYIVSGVAPADLTAGSQFLTVNLGRAQTEVTLGPVMFAGGRPDELQINAAFSAFRPLSAAEDVSIPAEAGVVLSGTLRIPNGHQAGPFPTVLLLGGSGPGQRAGITPFTERMLRDGIAVLEYDKRGVGQSTGQFVDTLKNMETDAAAAVRYLRTRPEVDPTRIALVGHSQGGAVAPAVAAEDPTIAAVVMFAGPVAPPVPPGPGHEINLVILKDMLAKSGAEPASITQVSEAAEQLFEAEGRNAPEAEITPLREAVIQGFLACKFNRSQAEGALTTLNSIVLEALNSHFEQTLARVRAPVLALFASDDVHVVTARNLPAAKAALRGNPDATVVEIADVDHWFRHVKNVSALEKSYAGSIAAPEVIKLAGDWLDIHLRPAKVVAASTN
jgi:pimeloyl-ACP methyl ester carboxylesterase